MNANGTSDSRPIKWILRFIGISVLAIVKIILWMLLIIMY